MVSLDILIIFRYMNESQTLCTSCGLCCDGSLFGRARINKNESLITDYIFTLEQDDPQGFRLPCSYLREKCCTIYEERPYKICKSFKCKLLKAYQTEKITFTEAAGKINEAFALKTKVELQIMSLHPENQGNSIHHKMSEFSTYFSERMSELEFRKEFGRLLLDYCILKVKLRMLFKKDHTNNQAGI